MSQVWGLFRDGQIPLHGRPPLGRESPNVFSIIGNGAGAMCQIGAGVGCREIGKGSNLTGHSDGPKKKLTFFLDKLDRPKVDRPLLQNHPSAEYE